MLLNMQNVNLFSGLTLRVDSAGGTIRVKMQVTGEIFPRQYRFSAGIMTVTILPVIIMAKMLVLHMFPITILLRVRNFLLSAAVMKLRCGIGSLLIQMGLTLS